ncbi:uncharacterized protein IWZ02DRAFT_487479 [Phyllosticta citriasiana]|uniref:uncharacterized protein n=1 Tax=Phyllosticta citriasiana TaxID=595635 RepID=UPI0030FD6350
MDHSLKERTLEFLDLPGEIRNMIYSECFPPDRALEVNFGPFNRYHSAQKHDLVMEEVLFKTCQEFDMLTPPVLKDRPNPHRIDVPRAPPSKSSSNQLDKETNGNRRRHFGAGLLSICMRT